MIFDYFDHVYIVSLPRHKERLARLQTQLRGLVRQKSMTVFEAIDGDQLPAPAYWKQGNGAWGCLQSHVRLMQTIWQAGHQRALILEDDAILDPASTGRLQSFFAVAPSEWGQMYLGGQHRMEPETKGGYFIGRSINRTHAYAVSRKAIPKILQHISHAPDYMENSYRHVDHQLEAAHQRRDWIVACPEWWVFGQGENMSSINGRHHPDKWWDWLPDEMVKQLPWVIVGPETSDRQLSRFRRFIHFGWTLANDQKTDIGIQSGMKRRTRTALMNSAKAIAEEAWSMRRLPAVAVKNDEQRNVFMKEIKPFVATFEDAEKFDFMQWADAQT